MIKYLQWRTLTDLHLEITISFLVAGITKFASDWCFGIFNRQILAAYPTWLKMSTSKWLNWSSNKTAAQ